MQSSEHSEAGESGGEAAEDCVTEDVLDEHRRPDSDRSTRMMLVASRKARERSSSMRGHPMRLGRSERSRRRVLKAPMRRWPGRNNAALRSSPMANSVRPTFAGHGETRLDGDSRRTAREASRTVIGFSRWKPCSLSSPVASSDRSREAVSGEVSVPRERSRGSSGRASAGRSARALSLLVDMAHLG